MIGFLFDANVSPETAKPDNGLPQLDLVLLVSLKRMHLSDEEIVRLVLHGA